MTSKGRVGPVGCRRAVELSIHLHNLTIGANKHLRRYARTKPLRADTNCFCSDVERAVIETDAIISFLLRLTCDGLTIDSV